MVTTLRTLASWAPLGLLSCLACESSTTAAEADHSVVINEVSSTDGDRIELVNATDRVVNLYGWTITDSSRDPNKAYAFPDGTYVAPGQFVVLYKGDNHAFGLGSKDGVVLLDPAGNVSDSTNWKSNEAVTSWCRIPDLTGPFRTCVRPTFGHKNPGTATGTSGGTITPTQVLTRSAALPLEKPDELGYDEKGRLWVGLPKLLQIAVVGADGDTVATIGGSGKGPGQFYDDGGASGPHAIRIRGGRAYATDRSGARVNIYDANTFEPKGALTDEAFADPRGIAILSDGKVWVSDTTTSTLVRFTADGVADMHLAPLDQTVTDKNGVACRIPCGAETLAVDEKRGRLFVTSAEAGRIEVVELASGDYTGQSVSGRQREDDPEPGRIFDEVEGLAVDAKRDLLFAVDEHNGRVLVFDLASPGLFESSAGYGFVGAFGGPGAAPGQMLSSDGLDINPVAGLLALADQENDRIQVFSLDTIAAALGR